MKDRERGEKIFESIIFVLVILSLIHIMCDEYANFMDFHVLVRMILLIIGFSFDLVFSIEFSARIIITGQRGSTIKYFTQGNGIFDFFSSIPVLLLYSLPLLWQSYFSAPEGVLLMLGGLRFFKTVRFAGIAKSLRFIRALKLFDKIKSRYIMTPEFIKKISIIVTVIIVVSLIGFYFVKSGMIFRSKSLEVKEILSHYIEGEDSNENFQKLLRETESVLFIKKGDETLYRSISSLFFQNSYLNDDYFISRIDGYEVYFNAKDIKKIHSYINMLILSIILGISVGLFTLFRRFFNKHISETLHMMLRGYKSASYLGKVAVQKEKGEFEIYQLTRQYNKKWIPIKKKILEIKKRHAQKKT